MDQVVELIKYLEVYKIENDWVKTFRYYNDMTWYTYSIAGMIPLLFMTIYRFFFPYEKPETLTNQPNFKRTSGFFFVKSLTFVAFYYYVIDVILTIIDGSYMNVCRFAFLTHHLPSIPLLYYINKLNYLPWWTLVIASWHAVLIAFPDSQLLNYPYLGFVFYFHYMHQYKAPYNTMKVYKDIKIPFLFVYLALVVIWWSDCKNLLPFL